MLLMILGKHCNFTLNYLKFFSDSKSKYLFVFAHRCIKAALLPSQTMCLETKPLAELKSPKFAEQFRVNIPEHKLLSKTLQVHVWSLSQANGEECLVSSASWLKVLSDIKLNLMETGV